MFSLEGHTAIVTGGGLRKRERKQLHRQGIAVARRTAVWRMRGLAARWGMRAAGEPDLPVNRPYAGWASHLTPGQARSRLGVATWRGIARVAFVIDPCVPNGVTGSSESPMRIMCYRYNLHERPPDRMSCESWGGTGWNLFPSSVSKPKLRIE